MTYYIMSPLMRVKGSKILYKRSEGLDIRLTERKFTQYIPQDVSVSGYKRLKTIEAFLIMGVLYYVKEKTRV